MDAIEVEGLRKSFGAFEAVAGISFRVRPGEIFAFLGPNGAGKTTTVKMLTTLLTPSAGRAVLDGHALGTDTDAVRRSIGVVFQDPSLDDELTARENLEIHGALYGVPRRDRGGRVDFLLDFVGLADRAGAYVKTFSGGMKRRLEIARALLHRPRILFLDEPTAGLDPQTRRHLWEHVAGLNREEGVTVFLTTHYMEEAERMATRVAVVDKGRLVAEGTPAELRDAAGASSLEEAFLRLTGHALRDEEAGSTDRLRQARRLWGRR